MGIGGPLLKWATLPLMVSLVGYFLTAFGRRDSLRIARIAYFLLSVLMVLALTDLFWLFITDRFEYAYVAGYSSIDLPNEWPHFFKISALWAGQEGTFLLWLVFALLLGF